MTSKSYLAIPLLFFSLVGQAPTVADLKAPSTVSIASTAEPGERMTVTGQVFGADGKTPLAGASVYVYHTDAKGLYTPENNDSRNPRLRGYMRTDAQGRYRYSTIKPAHYPDNTAPAHIHYVVNAQGFKERIFEIVFEGDRFLTEKIRLDAANPDSGFSIRKLNGTAQGGWSCVQDVIMKR